MPMEDEDDGPRVECSGCGRKFNQLAHSKHAKICKKVFQSKRKAFDSQKKRIIDSEHASLLKHKEMMEKKMGGKMNLKPPKKNKWKQQSEEFRAVMRQNRGLTINKNTGKGITNI
jgi:hypothetical protein